MNVTLQTMESGAITIRTNGTRDGGKKSFTAYIEKVSGIQRRESNGML